MCDRPVHIGGEPAKEIEITLDMISAGVNAYKEFNPGLEEPETIVFEIIYRAFKIAHRNAALKTAVPGELTLPAGSHLARLSGSEPPK